MRVESERQISPWLPAPPSSPATPIASATPGVAACWLVEFRAGLRSLPYLADHGFHDMAVLPGAFHIGLVRKIHRELFHHDPVSLRQIEFEKPVILADDDVAITVQVEKRSDGRVTYELFEAASDAVRSSPGMKPCARMQVDAEPATASDENEPIPIHTNAVPLATGADFYRQLRGNGNQYGPHFQTLADIRRSGAQIVGRFADAAVAQDGDISPPLLDAASQLLSAFTIERGRTFILKSIEHLVLRAPDVSRPCWAIASRTESGDAGLAGSVAVTDANGACLWELSGVTLAFIERPASAATASAEETRLCVASTFTAEPLEDSLRFWAGHFGRTVRVDFAPYNQVFQQLLDPTGAFRRNRDGFNVLVLGIEDWLHENRPALLSTDPARASACFGHRPRHSLPNGIEIVHLNRYETDYVWQEIFGDESYLRHGIQLADGDTVVDIGANIGLFSLFVMSRCRNPAIFAFEPSPRVFDLLRANCAAYGDPARVRAFHCGVAEKKGSAQFTFYEHSSVFSSFHPDENEDRAAIEAVVRNVLHHELPDSGAVRDADIGELTAGRMRAETIECPLTSVSDIIRDHCIERIHLLKIDAEKSEMGILRGIEEAHWPLIEQIVIEVHDRTRAAVQSIEEQLTRRGYRCAVAEEKLLEHSGLFNIYATRRAPAAAADNATDGLQRKVAEFCTALDTFATSAPAPMILAIAPRSTGTADAALNTAEQRVLARAALHSQIRTIGSQEILTRYPVRELHDAHSRQLGHMPFTQEGYAALGTALFRAAFNAGAPPVKVIVLDCDNTLWQGLCAEDGAAGIAVTPPFRRLQEFMIAQMHAGVLLALCSKNQEADVLAVFDQRADMPLRREHLAGWRINWEPKPENLRALAAQLNLGLNGFVFLDDNPLECAVVRAGCPEVIVLQLPQQHERIPGFLESLWIFDRTTTTREDRERNQWYQANSGREELRATAPTLRDFLDGLQLRIDVAEATDDQLPRVAQLTLRTNQFNLTSIRRSETEIRELLKTGATCLVTSVSDRFGDYGIVGAILCSAAADRCTVDTMLLSCRALGKGVEHRMVAELASRALRDGKSIIELPFRRTDRNEPAEKFIGQFGSVPTGSGFVLELPSAALAELRYEPDGQTASAVVAAENGTASLRHGFDRTNLSAAMQQLGDELNTIEAVVAAMESSRLRSQPANDPAGLEMMEGASALEQSLAAIWKKALGRTHIGFTENFFDAGGTSLKAVVVVAMIRRELKRNVSIISLFECPTIRLLAAKLDGPASPADGIAATAGAKSRGQQRRDKLIKRKVA
jgi:FkbH-like protein/FkbM family methyltransferase